MTVMLGHSSPLSAAAATALAARGETLEPSVGIEPTTSSLPMTCSTTELQGRAPTFRVADESALRRSRPGADRGRAVGVLARGFGLGSRTRERRARIGVRTFAARERVERLRVDPIPFGLGQLRPRTVEALFGRGVFTFCGHVFSFAARRPTKSFLREPARSRAPSDSKAEMWSGRRESNPRLLLGRQGHYHYATPASTSGGQGGIRTPVLRSRTDLQSVAFNHSATYPRCRPPWVIANVARVLSPYETKAEPTIGLEPMTGGLQNRCSTN